MTLLLAALATLLASGVAALLWQRSPRAATFFGAGGAVAGGALGLVPAIRALLGAPAEAVRTAWDVPYGSLSLDLDALSGLFLVPIFGLSAVAAVYGAGYLAPSATKRSLGPPWFFYDLLVASMALVVLAGNAVLFLVAWEVMAIASFFLVTFEDEREDVREAGRTYLVATHIGTAFLIGMFLALGRAAGSLDFEDFAAAGLLASGAAGLLFVLALVGFGAKAGFLPLHVWLPEAHPAAPSHVSALMSGVMIKVGIYGLLRTLTFLGPPPAWWGWLLVGIGITSGVLGVVFALAQHDLKRLLAYHSVENIGIIALGLGVGLLGVAHGKPVLAALGFAGGLLHVVNHALFKGLLFLGAGSVLHATGTREIDRLGGLLKRMPSTGFAFLVGAAAITGLPPLNGFVSEFLILLGAFRAASTGPATLAVPALATIVALAVIGGLAAACFTKAFGIVFLGEPRSDHAGHAHESSAAMTGPMLALAAACLAVGLLAPLLVPALGPAVDALTHAPAGSSRATLDLAGRPLVPVAAIGAGFLALVVGLAALRRALLSGRPVGSGPTWDCGYARPTPRMQYSASSFAQPLTTMFAAFLRTRVRLVAPEGMFPRGASLATETPDACREGLFRPAFGAVGWLFSRFRWLQHGSLHLYVLYIAVTLVALLLWEIG